MKSMTLKILTRIGLLASNAETLLIVAQQQHKHKIDITQELSWFCNILEWEKDDKEKPDEILKRAKDQILREIKEHEEKVGSIKPVMLMTQYIKTGKFSLEE